MYNLIKTIHLSSVEKREALTGTLRLARHKKRENFFSGFSSLDWVSESSLGFIVLGPGYRYLPVGTSWLYYCEVPSQLFHSRTSWIPPESVKELYFHFTEVTVGFFHLDGDFRPWRHAGSTKQGEFLISCIHFTTMDPWLTTGSIHTHRIWKYRPRGMISTGFHHCRRCCDWWQRHPPYTKQGEFLIHQNPGAGQLNPL
jgi:hypothetical protein